MGASSVQLARRGLLARQLGRLLALVRHLLLHPALRVGQPNPGLGAPFSYVFTACGTNTYQGSSGQTSCTQCPAGKWTNGATGGNSLAACVGPCACTRFIRSNTVEHGRTRHLGFTQAPCICSACVCTYLISMPCESVQYRRRRQLRQLRGGLRHSGTDGRNCLHAYALRRLKALYVYV